VRTISNQGEVQAVVALESAEGACHLVSRSGAVVRLWEPEEGRKLNDIPMAGADPLLIHLFESEEARHRLLVGRQDLWAAVGGGGCCLDVWDLGDAPVRGTGLRPANKQG
jgi:hypothetical protein